jgi:hypothetical protein
MSKSWISVSLGFLLLGSGLSVAQQKTEPTLNAREIFYKANTKQPATVSAPGQKAAPAAPARTTPPPPQKATPPAAPAEARKTDSPRTPAAATVAMQTVAYSPLGMRYGLLRRSAPGQYDEVDSDTIFRSGDGLRVSIESNDDAYLYIVTRGTSGTWNVLFPNAAINKGDNRIEAHQRQSIPAGGQFTFDEREGTERVFVVLSRTQQSDLESLIYDLDRAPAPAQRQATPPLRTIAQKLPAIPDELVGKIRTEFTSRDLVFEKVDDTKSERKEKATYVVNAKAASDSRVVVDLSLKHK